MVFFKNKTIMLATSLFAANFFLMSGLAINKATAASSSEPSVHWGYEDEESGPGNWGELDESFSTCSDGEEQSPIEIDTKAAANSGEESNISTSEGSSELKFHYQSKRINLINNGHTVQADNYRKLEVDGTKYKLLQFHFHHPSEHTVDGKQYDIEMHFVHQDSYGHLAVLGVFIEQGEKNGAFKFWSDLPKQKDGTDRVKFNSDLKKLLPKNRSSFRYDGSLTTPPCSEGVKWIILANPVKMSKKQIGAFVKIYKKNNRPVQPLNGRNVKIHNQ